jgi:hypothetical protein
MSTLINIKTAINDAKWINSVVNIKMHLNFTGANIG